jgi:Peptidase A4 family
MVSKAFGCLLALALVPALAQVPNAPASPQTESVVAPRQHAPRKVYPAVPPQVIGNVTVEESTNWSGYAVTGTDFTSAKGSWVVPTVDCTNTPNTYAAFWVGIDGWTSDTVEQTGTDSDCDGKTPTYYAWYEFYPAASVLISSIKVTPGDVMAAEVLWKSGTEFTIAIKNETTGKVYEKTGHVSGAERSSAEWIAEAPCCTNSGGILPLSDYGTVDFGQDYSKITPTNDASASGVSGPIADFGTDVFESIMVNGSTGADESVPSALSSDGTSFSAKWDSE